MPAGHPGQTRPLPVSQGAMNGAPPNAGQIHVPQMAGRGGGVPQAQMQSYVQGQQMVPPQHTPDNMRVIMEAQRLQDQQRVIAQQRQHYPQPNGQDTLQSTPSMGNLNMAPQPSAAMIANYQAANGKMSPAGNGPSGIPRSSASPHMAHAVQAQQLSSGMVPVVSQISSQLKSRHPQATADELRAMTADSLNHQLRAQNAQAATQAAAGMATNSGVNLAPPTQQPGLGYNAPMMNPQMYAQFMRNQQEMQSHRNGGSEMNGGRPPSRGGTPQMRNGNPPGGANQSPRPPQAQIAGAP